MTRDNRYTVTPEALTFESPAINAALAGRNTTAYVLRFCGKFESQHATAHEAWQAAEMHQQDRLAPRTRGVMAPRAISQGVQHG